VRGTERGRPSACTCCDFNQTLRETADWSRPSVCVGGLDSENKSVAVSERRTAPHRSTTANLGPAARLSSIAHLLTRRGGDVWKMRRDDGGQYCVLAAGVTAVT